MQTKSQEAGKWVFRFHDGSTLATQKFLKNKTLMISLTHELEKMKCTN